MIRQERRRDQTGKETGSDRRGKRNLKGEGTGSDRRDTGSRELTEKRIWELTGDRKKETEWNRI